MAPSDSSRTASWNVAARSSSATNSWSSTIASGNGSASVARDQRQAWPRPAGRTSTDEAERERDALTAEER